MYIFVFMLSIIVRDMSCLFLNNIFHLCRTLLMTYAQSPYPLAAELYGNLCPSLLFLQMSYVTSQNNEMDFIRLILSKARMLQVMEVKMRRNSRGIEIKEEICGYDKVSPRAQIRFKN